MSEPVLRLDGVSKVYGTNGQEFTAVDGANLAVAPGELVMLMGPSGAGKTTLLQIAGCLLRPSAGRVWLGDVEASSLTERRLPALRLASVGFVFQAFQLLGNLTALENVRVVLEEAGLRRAAADSGARELLVDLGLEDRLDARPATLSGGEKQRVAIARALANDPSLILADEPTGSLDSQTGGQVMRLIASAVHERGKSVLCATHDDRIRDIADRIVRIEDGRICPA